MPPAIKDVDGSVVRRDARGDLDEGAMRPTAFARKELAAAEEARIGELVKKAAS